MYIICILLLIFKILTKLVEYRNYENIQHIGNPLNNVIHIIRPFIIYL